MKMAVNKYQFVVEYPTSLEEKDQKENLKNIEKHLVKEGVKVTFASWGEKELAYAIKGQTKVKFWIGEIEIEDGVSVNWGELKIFLNRDKQVLRYLFLKI